MPLGPERGGYSIRGITKSVSLTVEDLSEPSNAPWGHERLGLSGSAKAPWRMKVLRSRLQTRATIPCG
jgi:hypothetical protein